jgi:hypothetical protein
LARSADRKYPEKVKSRGNDLDADFGNNFPVMFDKKLLEEFFGQRPLVPLLLLHRPFIFF